ncbi:MAG: alkaline phosphatase family protein [Geminicoccaceae bacterium]
MKTLVLGLELGDGPLLLQGARDGRLPRLRALLDRGTTGALATTAEQLHVSAWPSLYTGTGPGQHGVYFTFQPAPGVQGHQRFFEGLYGRPTVWRMAAEAGRRCVVMDAPYSHAEAGYGGPEIIDWGSWAQYLKTQSVPPALLGELKQAVGDYPLGLEAHDIGLAAQDAAAIEARILRALPAKAQAASWLLRRGDWDLAFIVFGETHPAAHYCWTPGDPAQTRLMRIYAALDKALGEVIDAAGDDTAVLVVSGDAVGPNNAGWHLLPEVLARLGHFASAEFAQAAGQPPPQPKGFDPVKAVRDLLPKDFRKSLARMMPTGMRDKLAKRVDTASIDWSRTRAFCLPTDLEGLIRVNLRGREPMGIVEPGADYEALLDQLEAEIRALVEPSTGQPVVADVLRTDRVFPGPRRDYLPDLIVVWERAAPVTTVSSAAVGAVAAPSPDGRPGTHKGPGFLLACGPGIPTGHALERPHIFDLAPTLLSRLGVPVPAHIEGRPWPALAAP